MSDHRVKITRCGHPDAKINPDATGYDAGILNQRVCQGTYQWWGDGCPDHTCPEYIKGMEWR